MNRRFKLLKRAVETKDQNIWADYKRPIKARRQRLSGKRYGEGEPYELFLLYDS